jgi:YhcH/YjgK/YiaL family protein
MIIAALEDLTHQIPALPLLEQALRYIEANRERDLADGRHEIDGRRLYALVQSFETLPVDENNRYEAHRDYIDVQYICTGTEGMGWAPQRCLQITDPYNPEKDVLFGQCPAGLATFTLVAAGQAAIFFPEDAHAPKLAVGAPGWVKKIVVKVAIE